MAYNKQDWKNLPDQTTPISAERLKHMETQYDEAVAYTDASVALLSSESFASQSLEELANAQGWTSLWDPTNPRSRTNPGGDVLALQDLLGNSPQLSSTAPKPLEPGAFGNFSGIQDSFRAVGVNSALGDFHVLLLADYTTHTSEQVLLSTNSGSAGTGVEIAVAANGELHMRYPTGNFQAILPEGKALFEIEKTSAHLRLRVNGHLAFEFAGDASVSESNIILGGGFAGDRSWQGRIGLVLYSDHLIPRTTLNNMRRFILSQADTTDHGPLMIDPRLRVYAKDDQGRTVLVSNDPYHVPSYSMASVTKAINALVARKYLTTTASLDQDVTLLADDIFSGATNLDRLKAGDIFTVRELMMMMLGPSNDTAPRVIARVAGSLIPGSLPPRAKFVRAMQDYVTNELPGRGGVVANVRASSMLSAEHGVAIAKKLSEDPELTYCASRPQGTTVHSRGVDPRDVNAGSGIYNYYFDVPEHVCSKGGSVGSIWSHLVAVFDVDGKRYYVAQFGNHHSYYDGTSRGAALRRTATYAVVDALRTGVSISQPAQTSEVGTTVSMSGPRDVTDNFSGVTRSSSFPDPGIFIERVDKTVHINFVDVIIPSTSYSQVAAIPAGFAPAYRTRGVLREPDGSSAALLVLTTGQIFVVPSAGGTRVQGSASWPVSWVATEMNEIPGIPPDYYNGTDS